jgi:hypothetical protein
LFLAKASALCAAAPLQKVEQEPAWTAREAAAATAWWLLRLKKTFIEARSPLMPFRCCPPAPLMHERMLLQQAAAAPTLRCSGGHVWL